MDKQTQNSVPESVPYETTQSEWVKFGHFWGEVFTSLRERPARGEGELIGVIPERLEALRHRVGLVDRHQLRLVAAVLDRGWGRDSFIEIMK